MVRLDLTNSILQGSNLAIEYIFNILHDQISLIVQSLRLGEDLGTSRCYSRGLQTQACASLMFARRIENVQSRMDRLRYVQEYVPGGNPIRATVETREQSNLALPWLSWHCRSCATLTCQILSDSGVDGAIMIFIRHIFGNDFALRHSSGALSNLLSVNIRYLNTLKQ